MPSRSTDIHAKQLVKGWLKAILAALVFAPVSAQALTVSPYKYIENLTTSLLTPGLIEVLGSEAVSEDVPGMIGYFNNGADSIGLSGGALLTTGSIPNAPGPNDRPAATGNGTTAWFSFSFVTPSPRISLNYVFASEEYEEYVGSEFNDFFIISINGISTNGANPAVIPGTNDPISVNTVNQNQNTRFYRSNTGGQINTQYDGLTTILTAKADLSTWGTHNITFRISDVGDSATDSAVFIQSRSITFDGATPDNPLLPQPREPGQPSDAPWIFPEINNSYPSLTWWYATDVASNYIYSVADPNGPLFDQYISPPFSDPFEVELGLYTSGDGGLTYEVFLGGIFPGKLFDFTTPIDSFAIKRIDDFNIPVDPWQHYYLAGISFQDLGYGPVTVIQTPLVKPAPDPSPSVPGPLPVLGIGGAFGWSRQLRRRLRLQEDTSQCRT
ncbi:MAG: choice-of-anchor L domain-containing protein [Cyanobacteriota bacterium]